MYTYQIMLRMDLNSTLEELDYWNEIKNDHFNQYIERINRNNSINISICHFNNRYDELLLNVENCESIDYLILIKNELEKKMDGIKGYILIS